MGRIMGIDYGRKRSGVAVTDPLKIVAGNLATVPTHTLMQFIKDYIAREPVERIVVGQPTQLNGQPSESMRYITPFVKRLGKELPEMPIVMYDERFTSTIAHQAMIQGGMKKSDRRDKSRVDAIAATIILNDYLQSKFNQPDHTVS
jgi:putative Holliday junction resolvase